MSAAAAAGTSLTEATSNAAAVTLTLQHAVSQGAMQKQKQRQRQKQQRTDALTQTTPQMTTTSYSNATKADNENGRVVGISAGNAATVPPSSPYTLSPMPVQTALPSNSMPINSSSHATPGMRIFPFSNASATSSNAGSSSSSSSSISAAIANHATAMITTPTLTHILADSANSNKRARLDISGGGIDRSAATSSSSSSSSAAAWSMPFHGSHASNPSMPQQIGGGASSSMLAGSTNAPPLPGAYPFGSHTYPIYQMQFPMGSGSGLMGLSGDGSMPRSTNPNLAALTPSTMMPTGSVSQPRGRWSDGMTYRLIELRSKSEPRFRMTARPDKLWSEVSTHIQKEFHVVLPRHSTKDKWKNLRSSFRLINQGKHPSQYTKESWPFYAQMQAYMKMKEEADSNPDSLLLLTETHTDGVGQRQPNTPRMEQVVEGEADESAKRRPDTSSVEGEEDGESDTEHSEEDEGEAEVEEKDERKEVPAVRRRRQKRRRVQVVSSQPSSTTAAAAAPTLSPSPFSTSLNELSSIHPLVDFLKLRDAPRPRKERDWAQMVRNLSGNITEGIQECHQRLLNLTSSLRDLADRMAPSASGSGARSDSAAVHALRVASIADKVDVVRADSRHISLLLPLFDAYRTAFNEHNDEGLARCEQFLRQRMENKNECIIFIALPKPGDDASSAIGTTPDTLSASASADAAAAVPPIPSSASPTADKKVRATSRPTHPPETFHSSEPANGTTINHENGRLPSFAYGFIILDSIPDSLRLQRRWMVSDLFVHPSTRRQGLASLLLTHARKAVEECGVSSIELCVRSSNVAIETMMQRMEWKKEAETARYVHKV